MSNMQALGMELEWKDDKEFTVSPISAIVVVKGFDSDGDETHALIATPGVSHVEAAGMLKFAQEWNDWNLRVDLFNTVHSKKNE